MGRTIGAPRARRAPPPPPKPTAWACRDDIQLASAGRPDILIWDPWVQFPSSPSQQMHHMGGSELYAIMLATELGRRGHKVVMAHGGETFVADGVQCIRVSALRNGWNHWPTKTLCVQRGHSIDGGELPPLPPTVAILAHDTYGDWYDVHRPVLESGRARLLCNSQWQARGFSYVKDRRVVYPMVMPAPVTKKVRGRFVFASSAIKGLAPTLSTWTDFCRRHPVAMSEQSLLIVYHTGWGDQHERLSSYEDASMRVSYAKADTPEEYRRLVASAEGLFFVNTYHETWCNLAVIAEQARTRTHILCRGGLGGLPEALTDRSLVTEDASEFERRFLDCLGQPPATYPVVDRSPSAVVEEWERQLGLAA